MKTNKEILYEGRRYYKAHKHELSGTDEGMAWVRGYILGHKDGTIEGIEYTLKKLT